MYGSFTHWQDSLLDGFWRLHQQMDQLLGDTVGAEGDIRSLPRGSFPAINVVQTPEALQVYVFAPGIDPKKLEVSVQQGLLTVAGQRQLPVDQNVSYYRQERFTGQFRRAVALGDDIDPEHVEARYRDGIVQIRLQRRESAMPRQIEVK
ncbi:MAG TPA: Hsp20/alpha crystallin family protein [Steroidobacteraceae bacterium]|jgi:HSP20 family protein